MPNKIKPLPPVAAEVRAEMARQRLTQEQLSTRLGVHQTWVSKRVTGRVPFRVEEIERVAKALDKPISQFVGVMEPVA